MSCRPCRSRSSKFLMSLLNSPMAFPLRAGFKARTQRRKGSSRYVAAISLIYEIDQITVPTVLMIGQKDTTAIGKDRAPPELAKALGNYPDLGRKAHERIKGSVLVPFADLGHSPQVQDSGTFNKALIEQLTRM